MDQDSYNKAMELLKRYQDTLGDLTLAEQQEIGIVGVWDATETFLSTLEQGT